MPVQSQMSPTPLPTGMASGNNYSMPVSGNASMSNVQSGANYQDWNQDRWGVNSSVSGDVNTMAAAVNNSSNNTNSNAMMNANINNNNTSSTNNSTSGSLTTSGGYDVYNTSNSASNNYVGNYNSQQVLPQTQPQQQQQTPQMRGYGGYRPNNYMQQGGMNVAPHQQQQQQPQSQQMQAPLPPPSQQQQPLPQMRGYGGYRAGNYMQQGGMNMAPHQQQQPQSQQMQPPMHMQGQGNAGYNRPFNSNPMRGQMLNNATNNNMNNADGGMIGMANYNSRAMQQQPQQQGYVGNNNNNNPNMVNRYKP